MNRKKLVDGVLLPFTAEEEAEADARVAAHAAEAPARHNAGIWQQIANIERRTQMPRHVRDLIPADHPARTKPGGVNDIEAEIAALKAQLL